MALAFALAAVPVLTGAKPARAGPEPQPSRASVLARLRAAPGLAAHYREEKHFAVLVEPLVSEGVIHFMPPHTLVRRQTSPTPALLVIDDRRLIVRDEQRREELDLTRQPVLAAFVASFMRVLAGDAVGLERRYLTEFEPSSERRGAWRMRLQPRDAGARKLVENIVLTGVGAKVSEVEIRETSGDRTVMKFSRVDLDRRYSADERRRLLAEAGAGE